MNKTIRLAVLLSTVLFLYGCAIAWIGVGAGLGVGAFRYIKGAVEKDYALDYGTAWEVTNTALANRDISVSNSMDEGVTGKIEGTRKDGKNVIIRLKFRQNKVTTINIRVGFWGSYRDAESLHEEISSVAGLK